MTANAAKTLPGCLTWIVPPFIGGAERLIVYGKDALRQLHYRAGAAYAILEIEANYWRLIGMAVKVDDHLLRVFPSLEIEIGVSIRKAFPALIDGQDAAAQIQTL